MSLKEHAINELKLLGMYDSDDEINREATKCIMELIEVFSSQGHSGFSASYCLDTFGKLASYLPLTALTGEDSEWNDVGAMNGAPLWQNKRCSRVFKEQDGSAFDVNGKVFIDADNVAYTNADSRVKITFPYLIHTEYVRLDGSQQ